MHQGCSAQRYKQNHWVRSNQLGLVIPGTLVCLNHGRAQRKIIGRSTKTLNS